MIETEVTTDVAQEILALWPDADLSIIGSVIFLDGWATDEEWGTCLIFRGIDDTIHACEAGYCVYNPDRHNGPFAFDPAEIWPEEIEGYIAAYS